MFKIFGMYVQFNRISILLALSLARFCLAALVYLCRIRVVDLIIARSFLILLVYLTSLGVLRILTHTPY